jgi:hypothetical protein
MQVDMWGYQSLSVVRALSCGTSKGSPRRASKMRTRASLGRSLMSTIGVRSKHCVQVVSMPNKVVLIFRFVWCRRLIPNLCPVFRAAARTRHSGRGGGL